MHNLLTLISQMHSTGSCQRSSEAHRVDNIFTMITMGNYPSRMGWNNQLEIAIHSLCKCLRFKSHASISFVHKVYGGLNSNSSRAIDSSPLGQNAAILADDNFKSIFITRVSEVIMFSPCVFVCVCLYHDDCPDDLTMKDWCHTNNILQVHCWGCLDVQVMFHTFMTPSMTSPGH